MKLACLLTSYEMGGQYPELEGGPVALQRAQRGEEFGGAGLTFVPALGWFRREHSRASIVDQYRAQGSRGIRR